MKIKDFIFLMLISISTRRKVNKMRIILVLFLIILPVFLWSYDLIRWKEISTDHFNFIFEEKDETTAFELASRGEEVYSLVCNFFQFYPEKVNVYINGRVDIPNGSFYPIPGSINLYPVYPLNSENSTKSESWLFELLLHEMVHYVNLENPRGFFGVLSHIFGKDLAAANGAFLPAWLVEGIAVYLETKYTKGGRGKNKYFEAYNKAAALEGKFYSIYQLAYSSDFPPLNRIYSGGYFLTKYLMENYGEDIFQKIYLTYVRFPFFGPYSAIVKETGKNIREIFEDYKIVEQRKYASERGISDQYSSIKLSPPSYSNWTHPVSTDKGILIYRRDLNKKSAIVLFDEENQKEEVIVEVDLLDSSSFNADSTGEIIIFSKGEYSFYHMHGNSLKSSLYIYENDKISRLSEKKSLFQPAISQDGACVVAVERNGSYSRLISINRSDGKITTLFEKEQTNVMNPVFSPDSEKLAFIVNDHGYQDVYIMDMADPLSSQPLFSVDSYSEYYPRFIDENEISFISDRDGDLSLYSYDLNKGVLGLLFKDPVGVMDGFIDGNKIYYNSYRTEGNELRIGKLKKKVNITFNRGEITPPLTEITPIIKRTYIDWTFPYLWLPKPDVNISTTQGIQWGAGIALFAGSYGQSGEWFLDLNYIPGLEQINGSFDYTQKLGRWTFSYDIKQSFDEIYNDYGYIWKQTTDQMGSAVFPFIESHKMNWRNVLNGYLSFRHKQNYSDPSSFTFTGSFNKERENHLYAGTGLIFNGYNTNYARKALFGDLSVYNKIDFSLQLPLLSSVETAYIIKESLSLKIPLGPEGYLLQTGWQGAYHDRGYSSTMVNPRGWSPSVIRSDLSFFYNMDYLIPIALVDWGLPYGFNIQNIAATIHFEGLTNLTFEGTGTNEFYCGFEFIGTYGYNYGSIPAGAGLNLRIYNKGESFDPAEDIKLYFFLSFNSLY